MKDVDPDSCLEYENVVIGLKVIDNDNNIGTIKENFDVHNIQVEFQNGGFGLYCLDPLCENFDPLYPYEIWHYN